MCGRFSFTYEDFSAIIEYFGIGRVSEPYEQRWNIAPSQQIPAILADGSMRRFGTIKWGLLPAAWNGGGPKPIKLERRRYSAILGSVTSSNGAEWGLWLLVIMSGITARGSPLTFVQNHANHLLLLAYGTRVNSRTEKPYTPAPLSPPPRHNA